MDDLIPQLDMLVVESAGVALPQEVGKGVDHIEDGGSVCHLPEEAPEILGCPLPGRASRWWHTGRLLLPG